MVNSDTEVGVPSASDLTEIRVISGHCTWCCHSSCWIFCYGRWSAISIVASWVDHRSIWSSYATGTDKYICCIYAESTSGIGFTPWCICESHAVVNS